MLPNDEEKKTPKSKEGQRRRPGGKKGKKTAVKPEPSASPSLSSAAEELPQPPARYFPTPRNASAGPSTRPVKLDAYEEPGPSTRPVKTEAYEGPQAAPLLFLPEGAPSSSLQHPNVAAALHAPQISRNAPHNAPSSQATTFTQPQLTLTPHAPPTHTMQQLMYLANLPAPAGPPRPPSQPLSPLPLPPLLNWPSFGQQRRLEELHRRPPDLPPPPVPFLLRPPQAPPQFTGVPRPRPLPRAVLPLTRLQREHAAQMRRLRMQKAGMGMGPPPVPGTRGQSAGSNNFNGNNSSMIGLMPAPPSTGVGAHAQGQLGPIPPWGSGQTARGVYNSAATASAHSRTPANWPAVGTRPGDGDAAAAARWAAANARYSEHERRMVMRTHTQSYMAPLPAGLPYSMARPSFHAPYFPGGAGPPPTRSGVGMHGPSAIQGTRGVRAPVTHAPAPAGATPPVPYQAPQLPVAGPSNVAPPQNARTVPEPPSAGPSTMPEPPATNISSIRDPERIAFEEAVERRRNWNPEADMFAGHCWYGYMGEDGFIHPFYPPRPCDGQCEHHRVLKNGLGGN
ncbi:uncharacterized protein TRAVEDRAFT_23210 [Trametes versicolor FP-101664 SS1]|uniref:uncharacterized protein n=1 Tax=Trametes versicolor (strain FP-101664) TaxID=717944 RepID=UPI0004622A74|nr:uncharacterized protein TRAVEDRAFT_23210 [Trametes versicolor FP-101664 SS1]EIW53957.1 hypothetical protein TRAVEDRAFT_23210 [Trametes versicolor FP-101664 SS1]